MKLAFSTLGCPEWGFMDILATAKDLGFDGVEIRGVGREIYAPAIPEFNAARIERTRGAIRRVGVDIPCLSSGALLTEADSVAEARAYIDIAAKLDIPYIRLLGDRSPAPGDEPDDETVRQNLAAIAAYGARHSVTPLLETNGAYADTLRTKTIVAGIDNAGVLWDVHHPYRYFNETPEYSYKNIGALTRFVHLKDSVADGELHYLPAGRGDVPIRECIRLLAAGGYCGYLSLEWVRRWDMSLESAGIAFAHYIDYMRKLNLK